MALTDVINKNRLNRLRVFSLLRSVACIHAEYCTCYNVWFTTTPLLEGNLRWCADILVAEERKLSLMMSFLTYSKQASKVAVIVATSSSLFESSTTPVAWKDTRS